MSDRENLLAFGFDATKVERALKATKNAGLQPALDWLEKYGDNMPPEEVEDKGDDEDDDEEKRLKADIPADAKSLRCCDCGKLFKSHALASYHGEKSGHANFEESTEEIKPLTEAEKAERLAELKSKMTAKRAQAAKADADAAKANEAIRRKGGKEQGAIKEEMKLREAEKEAAERKRDKLEEAKAKARVKEQIEADKRARVEKAAAEKARRAGLPPPYAGPTGPSAAASAAASGPSATKKDYPEARLQLRLPSGNPLITTMKAEDSLQSVVDWLVSHPQGVEAQLVSGMVKLSTTFPRKVFTPEEMTKTLKELGLTPSAVLVVTM